MEPDSDITQRAPTTLSGDDSGCSPHSSEEEEPTHFSVGFNSYKLLALLGEGGMGKVYLAEQAVPKRKVALKLIKRQSVSQEFLTRFASEYQILALMTHQNIARIYDAGTTPEGEGDGTEP